MDKGRRHLSGLIFYKLNLTFKCYCTTFCLVANKLNRQSNFPCLFWGACDWQFQFKNSGLTQVVLAYCQTVNPPLNFVKVSFFPQLDDNLNHLFQLLFKQRFHFLSFFPLNRWQNRGRRTCSTGWKHKESYYPLILVSKSLLVLLH